MSHSPAPTPATRDPRVVAGLLVGVLAVSISAILARYALETADAIAIAFWRCLGGAVALAPLAWREHARGARVPTSRHRQIRWSGVLLAIHFALFIGALDLTTVASAVLFATMSPVFVAVGAARFLGEQTTRRLWTGIGVSMVGAVIVAGADASAFEATGRALLGDLSALLSTIAVTGYMLLGRSVRRDVPAATYSCLVFAWSSAALLGVALASGTPLAGYSTSSWLAILGIIAGPQLLGHTVFNTLLARVRPAVVSLVVLSEPVLATLLAIVLLAETPAALFWLGAPIVLAGVGLGSTAPSTVTGRAQDGALASARPSDRDVSP